MTAAILLLVCLALGGVVVALLRSVRRLESRLAILERGLETGSPGTPGGSPGSTSELRTEETPVPPVVLEEEYVITRLGEEPRDDQAPTLEGRLFADIVLRETVVKAASWTHGVRRALSPANRNRIWFEMRREVKRTRKQRRAEERQAIREFRARQRAAVRESDAA